MRTGSLERLTAIAGLVVVALSLVNLAVPPPPHGDDPSAYAGYYSDHRGIVLVGAYLVGLGSAVVLAFLAGLRDVLRRLDDRGESTLATVGLLAGVLQFAAVAVGVAILAAAAYRPDRVPDAIHTTTDNGWIVINLAAGPATAVSVAAFSIVFLRSRALPGWVAGVGFVVAAAHLVVAGAFARDGFFSPEGGVAVLVPTLYYLWVLVVSLALLRRRTPEPAT